MYPSAVKLLISDAIFEYIVCLLNINIILCDRQTPKNMLHFTREKFTCNVVMTAYVNEISKNLQGKLNC